MGHADHRGVASLGDDTAPVHLDSQTRVHAWKQSMSEDERHQFEAVAGGLLAELGYEVA